MASNEDELAEFKRQLRSCLTTFPDGLAPNKLPGEFRNLDLPQLPYREFGFNSIEDFILKMMSDVARLSTNKHGERVFFAISTKDTEHIASMVSKQRNPKKKSQKKRAPHRPTFGHRPPMTQSRQPSAASRYSATSVRPLISGHSNAVHHQVSATSIHRPANTVAGSQWRTGFAAAAAKPSTSAVARNSYNTVPPPSSSSSRPTSASHSAAAIASTIARDSFSQLGLTRTVTQKTAAAISQLSQGSKPEPERPNVASGHQRQRYFIPAPDNYVVTGPGGVRDENNASQSRQIAGSRLGGVGRGRGSPPLSQSTASLNLPQLHPPPVKSMTRGPTSAASSDAVYRVPSPLPDDFSEEFQDLRMKLNRMKMKVADNCMNSQSAAAAASPLMPSNTSDRPPQTSLLTDEYVHMYAIKGWLREKIAGKKSGLWSSSLDAAYEQEMGHPPFRPFAELGQWCADVVKFERMGHRTIVYPQDETYYTEDNEDALRLFHVTHMSDAARQTTLQRPEPDPLQLPASGPFEVHVEHVVSPMEIAFIIIGDEYSVKLEALEEELPTVIGSRVTDPKEGMICVSVVETECDDGSIEPNYSRVRIAGKVDNGQVDVWMLDYYGYDTMPLESLYALPAKYNQLPYQAVKCSLTGLEAFSDPTDAFMLARLEEIILDKKCKATVDRRSPDISVTLIDTDTNVNMNEALLNALLAPRIPKIDSSAKCSVCYVSDEGVVFLHFDGPGLVRLQYLLSEHLSSTAFPMEKRQSPDDVKRNELYAVFSMATGEWNRAVVCDIFHSAQTPTARVQYIDYGDYDDVNIAAIRSLPYRDLVKLPAQAVRCLLDGLPPAGASWKPEGVQLLTKWTAEADELTATVLSNDPLTVDLRVAGSNESLTTRLLNERNIWNRQNGTAAVSPALSPSDQSQHQSASVMLHRPESTTIVNGDEVYVTWVDDPSNFRIIPAHYKADLQKMTADMEMYYRPLNSSGLSLSEIVVGELYAVLYQDTWYRAVVKNNRLSAVLVSMVSVKFVDFGDHAVVKMSDMRPLPASFRELPLLALSVKLDGLSPCGTHWSEAEKDAFRELAQDNTFTVYVSSESGDADHMAIGSSSDHIYPVVLVQSLPDNRLSFLHSALASRGLAIRTSRA